MVACQGTPTRKLDARLPKSSRPARRNLARPRTGLGLRKHHPSVRRQLPGHGGRRPRPPRTQLHDLVVLELRLGRQQRFLRPARPRHAEHPSEWRLGVGHRLPHHRGRHGRHGLLGLREPKHPRERFPVRVDHRHHDPPRRLRLEHEPPGLHHALRGSHHAHLEPEQLVGRRRPAVDLGECRCHRRLQQQLVEHLRRHRGRQQRPHDLQRIPVRQLRQRRRLRRSRRHGGAHRQRGELRPRGCLRPGL